MEDSKADLFLIREAIATAEIDATVHVVRDGRQALEFIDVADADANAPHPDLIILDLNLPKCAGTEVLRHARNSRVSRNVRVLIVSSSNSAEERQEAEALGFSGYFRKPSVYAEFMKLGAVVKDVLSRPSPS